MSICHRSWPAASLLLALAASSASSLAGADTLADIYRVAVTNDPEFGSASAGLRAQVEIVHQTRAGLLPTISVDANTAETRRVGTDFFTNPNQAMLIEQNFNDHGWSISAQQPVFRLDRWFQYRRARHIEDQAEANLQIAQQDLMVRVAETYFGILEADARLVAAQAEQEAVQRQLEQVQQRFDVGLAAITDVLESTAAYDTATVTVIEATGEQDISFETLRRFTGRNYNEIAPLDEDFPVTLPDPPDQDAWAELALAQNPLVHAADAAVKAAEKQLRTAQAAHLPSVDAQVSHNVNVTGGGSFFGNEIEQDTLTLRLNKPIYAGGMVRSQVREAKHRQDEAEQNLALQQRTVVQDTRSAYINITNGVARVQATLKGIESSQSALDATETGYQVGTRNIVDVLLAQQRLYAAQFQYASARYRYVVDILRLKQLVGSLSPEDMFTLSGFLDERGTVSRPAR